MANQYASLYFYFKKSDCLPVTFLVADPFDLGTVNLYWLNYATNEMQLTADISGMLQVLERCFF